MDRNKVAREDKDWNQVARDKVCWQAVVDKLMILRIP